MFNRKEVFLNDNENDIHHDTHYDRRYTIKFLEDQYQIEYYRLTLSCVPLIPKIDRMTKIRSTSILSMIMKWID